MFPVLGVKVKPTAGSALVFRNTVIGQTPPVTHESTLHAALPATQTKYVLNIWYVSHYLSINHSSFCVLLARTP